MTKTILSVALAISSALALRADVITVNGSVVSASDGEPIIAASVQSVDNPSLGVTTDIDGLFSIKVEEGSLLRFSYIGYKTQESPATPSMTIKLEENANLLDDVVVVGYQTQRKADLTGAVSVVKVDELKTNSDTDPMRALQGKVPGMTITSDGSPSGTGTIRIRGIGSFNSSQDPLFVIDGVPTTNTLNSLNANDIESIQVLKDAASASIYGSRAANGVIIITTKKGKKGEGIKIDFSASLTAQFYTNQSTMSLCNTSEYATAMAQAALNDGLDPVAYASNYGLNLNASAGIPISAYNPATGNYENYTVNGLYDGYINSSRTMRCADTDWLDAISRTGFTQQYNISMSNATERSTSMFSLGYKKAEGILKYTDFENIAARVNTSYILGKALTIGENFTLTHTRQVASSPMENALKMAPTVPVYEEDGETFSGPVGGMSDRQNPLRELYQNRDNELEVWRVFGNAYIDIRPFTGLLLRSNFGIDYDAAFSHYRTFTYHSDIVNNDIAKTSTAQANDSKWTWSNTAQYEFTLAEKNRISLLAGLELNSQSRKEFGAYAEGYDVETNDYMWPNAATGTQSVSGAQTGYRLVSFFGKVDYNYDDLLLASFTIRRDGSSRFGKNNRYGTFPAATLGYRISRHLKASWINELKLRASWGKTGNQAIDNNARYSLFVADYGDDRVTSTAYDLYLQGSGIFPSGYRTYQAANNNLKWETATQWNVGIDFAFFNNSLYGSADAFIKDVDDMLISPAYLGSMGEGGASWSNGPSLRNKGMEFQLGWRGSVSGLGYDINANLDFFRNKVTYLPSTATGSYAHTTTQNLVEAGVPYGSIVGYVVEGLYQSQEEVLASGQENARVGGLKYADLDGNGVINADDCTWIYNPVPDFSFGFNIALTYKGFDLSTFWQGVKGVDVYNNQKFQTDFWSITDAGSNKGNRLLGAWTADNTSSTIPALTTNNTGDEGRASTYFVEHGSWLKLRTLQIGYSLPTSIKSRLRLDNARIYVSGQNLLTIKSDAFTCSDPENGDWNYPHAASISVGIQLGF
ncbi:MAG: TonB-dependent receptor [Bacteroidales bacterium]|nr:TonB-dependent receptor [Bacteroidales bacterium]